MTPIPSASEFTEIPAPTGVFAEPSSVGKLLRRMAVFGPATIVASVAIGAGGTIIVVQAGSWARYDLLWLVLPREVPAWAPPAVFGQPILVMATAFGYVGGTVMGYLAYAN